MNNGFSQNIDGLMQGRIYDRFLRGGGGGKLEKFQFTKKVILESPKGGF